MEAHNLIQNDTAPDSKPGHLLVGGVLFTSLPTPHGSWRLTATDVSAEQRQLLRRAFNPLCVWGGDDKLELISGKEYHDSARYMVSWEFRTDLHRWLNDSIELRKILSHVLNK